MKLLFLFLALSVSLSLAGGASAADDQSVINGHKCSALPIPIYGKDYNREVGSYDYLPFALASMNAYGDGNYKDFDLANYDSGWRVQSPPLDYNDSTGMYANYYFKSGETLDVLIAFRGTRADSWKDWFSNFSWFTRFIPIKNEYDSARDAFQMVATKAIAEAGKRAVRFITTGHSLGGGLAQHVALAFPCVSAAVFDTSCITDVFRLDKEYTPDIVLLYEDKDELTKACRAIGFDNEGMRFRTYPVNYIPDGRFQHKIDGFVVGMARGVADCQREQRIGKRICAVPSSDTRAKELYCKTYGIYGPDIDICPELKARR